MDRGAGEGGGGGRRKRMREVRKRIWGKEGMERVG